LQLAVVSLYTRQKPILYMLFVLLRVPQEHEPNLESFSLLYADLSYRLVSSH